MDVLHVDPERGWGGGEVQVMALLRELAQRGHRSRLAADPRGRLAHEAAAAGVRVEALPVANALDVRAGAHLRALVAGHDVVHFHTARAHALAPFCRGRGARLVVTRRMDYVPRGGVYARWLYNRVVDAVIAISEGVRTALLRAGVRADRIRVVPSGIDVTAIDAPPGARAAVRAGWHVEADDVLVLVLGALERRKGHAMLLDAARRLASERPALRYVFAGDGSERAALAGAAHELGDRVVFAGFRQDIGACLAAADVVALPSLHEGLGVAALEAMAAGRPVVASRVGGLAEVVVDGETGLFAEPGEPESLATALATLAKDPGLRARLGEGGRRRVLARYTAARMAEGTIACYGEAPCAA
jgi:glycosyltransferase involved in cell wall biosynthesis